MNEGIRVALVSLGCARNLVDSEVLLGHAAQDGLALVREPRDADVVVINTCGFIEAAKQESIETILEAVQLKTQGQLKGVIAVGCLAERYADELAAELTEVDAVLGISDYSGVPAIVRQIVNGSPRRFVATVDGGQPKSARSDVGRVSLTPSSYAYLRISEGCDHSCTFCAIPAMRGRNRSKPIDVLVEEATRLAKQGIKELVVVAEDSTAYGLDIERRHILHVLLEQLATVDGIEWIRLMYAYPHTVKSELCAVMRENPKVVPYLDIPIQHISGPMLKAMKRGTSSQQVRDILWRLRGEVPGIAVRTTLLVGFPGETDQDFAELRDFVGEYRFERLGAFAYSPEEGTPAFELEDVVPEAVAEERRHEIMSLQRSIVVEANRALVGQEIDVLIDGVDPSRPSPSDQPTWAGRTTRDAPEVDCAVLFEGADLAPGRIVRARIERAEDYDLYGRVT
ncbi:MAG: 30S ribosomal protein S12 methylthiotransferase RimO [Planctomycetota bacterium]